MKTNRQLTKQVVSTYALTLVKAAEAEDRTFAVLKGLEESAKTLRGHRDLWDALNGDVFDAQAKSALIDDVFGAVLPAELVATLKVMAERKDLDLIGIIAESYRELAEKELNVVIAEIVTAVPLDDHLRQVITDKLSKEFGKDIHIEEKVDPSIIGGVIVNAQGKRIDASVATQLSHARTVLSKNVSIGGEE